MLEVSGRRVPSSLRTNAFSLRLENSPTGLSRLLTMNLLLNDRNSTQRLKTGSAKLAKTEAKSSDQAGSEQSSRLPMDSLDVAQRSGEDQPTPQRNDVEAFQHALLELTTVDGYEHYPAADDRYARSEEQLGCRLNFVVA
jgi:hypothetical protein